MTYSEATHEQAWLIVRYHTRWHGLSWDSSPERMAYSRGQLQQAWLILRHHTRRHDLFWGTTPPGTTDSEAPHQRVWPIARHPIVADRKQSMTTGRHDNSATTLFHRQPTRRHDHWPTRQVTDIFKKKITDTRRHSPTESFLEKGWKETSFSMSKLLHKWNFAPDLQGSLGSVLLQYAPQIWIQYCKYADLAWPNSYAAHLNPPPSTLLDGSSHNALVRFSVNLWICIW